MSTYAQEQAERLKNEQDAPFSATHVYNPTGWDQHDPRGVQGDPIEAGSKVQLLREHNKGLHSGMPPTAKRMFNVVRDASGNVQHVNRQSLGSLSGGNHGRSSKPYERGGE